MVKLAIKVGAKPLLYGLIPNAYIADGIRDFLMTGVWSLAFPLFAKLQRKRS